MTEASTAGLTERLKSFDGFLERLAKDHGLATLDLVKQLPAQNLCIVPGSRMLDILKDISGWGPILFITEGAHIITGQSAELPQVFLHEGYYHFFGQGGFGGHIEEGACKSIAFIDRPFQKRRSLSIHFYGPTGEPMFKIFVSRELSGEMSEKQVESYFALRDQMDKAQSIALEN
ncbi:MAG: heme utilization cystosolic carrier protein HutX [Pseudomonadota bacterium]